MIFENGLKELGVAYDSRTLADFEKYDEILRRQNEVMNLIAAEDADKIETRHFLECAALVKYMDFSNKSVIDIGSGAGFPGMPIKILERSARLTLLDSQRKRVDFLSGLCTELSLTDVSCIHARAEERALLREYRDSFDFAVSRALARLNILCELCMPFVKPGGVFAAMKTNHSNDESAEAGYAVKTLGGVIEDIYDYGVPGTDVVRRIILIRKTGATPAGYPRRYAKILKESLK